MLGRFCRDWRPGEVCAGDVLSSSTAKWPETLPPMESRARRPFYIPMASESRPWRVASGHLQAHGQSWDFKWFNLFASMGLHADCGGLALDRASEHGRDGRGGEGFF